MARASQLIIPGDFCTFRFRHHLITSHLSPLLPSLSIFLKQQSNQLHVHTIKRQHPSNIMDKLKSVFKGGTKPDRKDELDHQVHRGNRHDNDDSEFGYLADSIGTGGLSHRTGGISVPETPPIPPPAHVRVTTSDRFLTVAQLLDDDSIHRAGSVNPAIFKTAEQYQIDTPANILPKILVLFCGGTLIMRENPEDGSLVVNEKDKAIELLLGMEPRLHQEIASLEVEFIDNIDSSNMNPDIWDRLGKVILRKYEHYDGFVITHGTDTMAYTSSALSFLLQDIGRPVVITGAQIPGGRLETDARRNFVNAVRIAALDRAGVFLVFDGDIIPGARAHKMSESKLDAFTPINWGLLGEIRIDIRFSDDAKLRHDRPLQYLPGFDNNVAVYTIFPGFSPKELMRVIERDNIRGIILASYGSGNVCEGVGIRSLIVLFYFLSTHSRFLLKRSLINLWTQSS